MKNRKAKISSLGIITVQLLMLDFFELFQYKKSLEYFARVLQHTYTKMQRKNV